MLIESKHFIKVGKSRSYYESLGLKLPEKITKDFKLELNSSQLSKGSDQKIEYICDLCDKISSDTYKNYNKCRERNKEDRCYKCSRYFAVDWKRLKKEDVVKRLIELNGNEYTYEKLNYNTVDDLVTITCKIHGDFKVVLDNALYQGRGCAKCNSSNPERLIRYYLEAKKIKFEEQKKFKDLKHKDNLRLDFYLPELNSAIEYHGGQHFRYTPHFHKTIEDFENLKLRDKIKENYCKDNNINLIIPKERRKFINELKNYI